MDMEALILSTFIGLIFAAVVVWYLFGGGDE